MILADNVWGDDQFPVAMLIEVLDEYVFIGLPAATGNEYFLSLGELFNDRQLFSLLLDLEHTVETGVASDGHVVETYLIEELLALLVLYVEMGEAFQYLAVLTTVPAEEYLSVAENAGYAIYGYVTMLQDMQVVVPEFVLDEESHFRTYGTQEAACVGDGVEWQVADNVGSLVILAHLVA